MHLHESLPLPKRVQLRLKNNEDGEVSDIIFSTRRIEMLLLHSALNWSFEDFFFKSRGVIPNFFVEEVLVSLRLLRLLQGTEDICIRLCSCY